MTSTPVKSVSASLMDMTVSQTGKNAQGAGDFQKVWDSQKSKGAADGGVRGSAGRPAHRGSSLKARERQVVQSDDRQPVEELSPEEQEQAAEVMGAAAQQLMERLMESFGVSAEELQTAMSELGMEQMDILDAGAFSNLFMKLGGAADPYALLTDSALYERYQALTGQLRETLAESAEALGMDLGKLLRFLEKSPGAEPMEVPAAEDRQPVFVAETEDVLTTETSQPSVEKPQEPTEGQMSEEGNPSDGQPENERQIDLPAPKLKKEQFQPGLRQTAKTEQFQLGLQQTAETAQFRFGLQQTAEAVQSSPWSTDTREIMNQILDYMKLNLNGDSTSLEMQLHPASLGTVQVQIASRGGAVTANFIAQNEAVKTALETQMVQLREQFDAQGIKVEAIEVTVQTHEFERNLDEQGRGRGSQEPERRGRIRRINLSHPVSPETMDEEDALEAEMMAADGRTVDYTA